MEMLSTPQEGYTGVPGKTAPQGATLVDGNYQSASVNNSTGVNFSVYAPSASRLFLALFDADGQEQQLKMFPSSEGIWHIYVEGVNAGQLYGFRADGYWSPSSTPRFNKNKLLMDPYAREIRGEVQWSPELFDYKIDESGHWLFDKQDSAAKMPRSVVREADFDWQGVTPPQIPDQQSIYYETHLKGFTKTHPDIPEELRGTYLGMCHPVAIEYLKTLGITAVELMPITYSASEERLTDLNLCNYWGYNPLCMMAPHSPYAVKDPVTELKTMVRELHREGIEVIMDVVFNHTCEGGHGGPFLSMRGLAEDDYYLMNDHDGHLSSENYSGCGNTMNFDSNQTLRLTMDALRHWVVEYQIDGFRFDLAPTMARQHRHYTQEAPFFHAVHQDPILSQVKMIAEPWDIGPDGYHLTDFPDEWQAWNDRYRDGCRKFWKGNKGIQTEFTWRFAGSPDLFSRQTYLATVNYICSHDGFNLMDLVSYNERHNLANGEDGRDGDQHNHSWNHGVEGRTDDQAINHARLVSRKNLVGTLMLAKGTPMLLAGDEFSNSQDGNNNAYCQDSPIAWLDWSWLHDSKSDGAAMHAFCQKMMYFRRQQPLLTDELNNTRYKFFSPKGEVVDPKYFSERHCYYLTTKIYDPNDAKKGIIWVIMNASKRPTRVLIPETVQYNQRVVVIDTGKETAFIRQPTKDQNSFEVSPFSLMVIKDDA